MNVIVSQITANYNLRALLKALHARGGLACFHGTVAFGAEARWPYILPTKLRKEVERRRFELPARLIHSHFPRESVRLLAQAIGLRRLIAHEYGWACVDRVAHALDRAVARSLRAGVSAVYCSEDGALGTFARAKELGITRVYDLPIAYWETGRRLMAEDAERLPAWSGTFGGGVIDSAAKLERKTLELAEADLVVTPSQFVADSLPAWARNRRIIVPFGSPASLSPELSAEAVRRRGARVAEKKPLRVLFAGSMGQRKGLGDLFAAIRQVKRSDVELVVMGKLLAPMQFYRSALPSFTYESGRPHDQVLELMRSCDVFCLPSIVEGRALVLQEAMSQGLPLIITPNTGGADLVEPSTQSPIISSRSPDSGNGFADSVVRSDTGFLVPIRSPTAIAEAIAWYADHRTETIAMGTAAAKKAEEATWEGYGQKVVDAIQNMTLAQPN